MRPVHTILCTLLFLALAVACFECSPVVSDYKPEFHDDFKQAWLAAHPGEGDAAFFKNWKDRVHITYWEKWGAFEGDGAQKMVDAYNESQERVYCHYIRTSQVDRKAMLAIVGESPPDVVGLWDNSVIPFSEANALLPLDEMMAASNLTPDHYVPNYLKLCQYEGQTYALPSTPATVALYYNKDIFARKADELRAAGLDPDRPPETLDELDAYVDALSEFNDDGTPRIMGFLPTEPGWFHRSWGYFFGGRLADEEGAITFDEPENVEAYVWLKSYATKYGRSNLTRFQQGFGNYDSPQNAFVDEKIAMVLHGTYFAAFIDRHKPHLNYAVAPFPCAEGVAGPRTMMVEDVIVIPRGCPHPEEAWDFLHFTQTQGLPIICRLLGRHLPIAEEPDDFAETHPNPFLEVFRDLAHSEHSFIMPPTVVWGEYNREIVWAFDHIWHYRAPVAELEGLTGEARLKREEELNREEIVATLGAVTERMRERLEQKRKRAAMRSGGGDE